MYTKYMFKWLTLHLKCMYYITVDVHATIKNVIFKNACLTFIYALLNSVSFCSLNGWITLLFQ